MTGRGLYSFSSWYGPVVGCSDHYLQELSSMVYNCRRNGWRNHHNMAVCVLGYECGNFLTTGTFMFHVCVDPCSTWNECIHGSSKYNNKSSILLLTCDVSIDSLRGMWFVWYLIGFTENGWGWNESLCIYYFQSFLSLFVFLPTFLSYKTTYFKFLH
jgi:hypothetical protein